MTAEMSQVTDVCTRHGEGPVWDLAAGVLRFVDIAAGDVGTLDPATGHVSTRHVDATVGCLRPRARGGLVVAGERTIWLLDAAGDVEREVPIPEGEGVRFNDGACDGAGRFYCGTMRHDTAEGGGTLYRLDPAPGATPEVTLAGVTISNGLAFDPSGGFAYYVDTPTQRIDRVEVDAATGSFGAREPFVIVDPGDGSPDGIALDAEGGVWVALWGGSAVRRYAASGRLDAEFAVPARQVSAVGFGGEGLRDLYVTTSRQGLSEDDDPLAGSIFHAVPGVAGLPVPVFAG